MLKALHSKKWLSIIVSLVLLVSAAISLVPGTAAADDSVFSDPCFSTIIGPDGSELGLAVTPATPPLISMAAASAPEVHIAGSANSLSDVPAYDWTYGCAATAASMLFGYYDRHGYPDMYTGPTNGGVCPLTNEVWGHTTYLYPTFTCGEMPMIASHLGYDGRTAKGHVDDYWKNVGWNSDPYDGAWAEHTPPDCVADFMGTNQYAKFGNGDGNTSFTYYNNGSKFGIHGSYNDYWLVSNTRRDGAQGAMMYAQNCGYAVTEVYTQPIDAMNLEFGFTFTDYMAEIDAGYPVLIHVTGHLMIGYGYDADSQTIYLNDTWDYNSHSMTWGGSYAGRTHWGVTVIHLASPGYNQVWWLDSETDAGGQPVMENSGMQSGFIAIEKGATVLWYSNTTASGSVVFNPGVWTLLLNTDELNGNYAIQIGEYSPATGFTAFNIPPETGKFQSPKILYITLPSVTVPNGHNLALLITHSGWGGVYTNHTSYLIAPFNEPSFPLPELASGILAGLGFLGLGGFIIIKKRQARALTEA